MPKFRFRSSFLLSFIALIGLGLFISLGFWQLERYYQKKYILMQLAKKSSYKPLALNRFNYEAKNLQSLQYQPVVLQGYFFNHQQFLLDNQIYRGQIGYDVLTPIKLVNKPTLVLLNRGWIPADKKRHLLPRLSPVLGQQTIHGIIRIPLAKGILLKAQNWQTFTWPLRIQQIDFLQMAKKLGHPLYPFVVLLDKNMSHGFVREWKFINLRPEKHLSYAFQWFLFALLLIVIYFTLTIKKREKEDDSNTTK